MIAAGWDTARNVAAFFGALWTVVFVGFGALGLLCGWVRRRHQASMRERRTATFETLRADNDLRAQLDADVQTLIGELPAEFFRLLKPAALTETDVERAIAEIRADDCGCRILREARRGRPYDHEIDG